jgi:hypothetical protein
MPKWSWNAGPLSQNKDGTAILRWAAAARLEAKPSIVLIVCRVSLTIHDLTILRDRHVDARTAFDVGKFDGLRHIVGIFPTMIHGFKAKAATVHLRVLRPPLGR